MPLNGAIIRGHPGPHITRTGRTFNPETGLYTDEVEFSGSNVAIQGLAARFRDQNRDFRLTYEEGFARVTVYTEVQGSQILDKYEIVWEMEQRELWNHPTIKGAASAFDQIIPASEDSFRKRAENFVDGTLKADSAVYLAVANDPVSGPTFRSLVTLLLYGITNWEQEYVILRRTRTIPPEFASPVSIYAASLIYTTQQLDLPATVLFQLPDITLLEEPVPGEFRWGWKRRPSSSVIQGQSNEQASEFVLAAWPLLLFQPATSNADW